MSVESSLKTAEYFLTTLQKLCFPKVLPYFQGQAVQKNFMYGFKKGWKIKVRIRIA